jgi:hypothetical protein
MIRGEFHRRERILRELGDQGKLAREEWHLRWEGAGG